MYICISLSSFIPYLCLCLSAWWPKQSNCKQIDRAEWCRSESHRGRSDYFVFSRPDILTRVTTGHFKSTQVWQVCLESSCPALSFLDIFFCFHASQQAISKGTSFKFTTTFIWEITKIFPAIYSRFILFFLREYQTGLHDNFLLLFYLHNLVVSQTGTGFCSFPDIAMGFPVFLFCPVPLQVATPRTPWLFQIF